ncbi:putative serine dehydratase domain-containing protein [Dichomitus squalens]|uniref:D-serine dehydratase n=1 Tax=Dichomitus squalens TaxID=114155 RepID=A0A4Q9NUP7_9APHY|nr:putative serine dehydratase domain-containing protein [Dichomitus squalens]TBU63885.1 putative serine dehydratase domain-containing protein [Dichomitus squalens]
MGAEEHPQSNPLVPKQSRTPYHISGKPEKQDLVDEYKGQNLDVLRTPALVIDRAVFARNCAKMHQLAQNLGARFRAHVKSHKTPEGTRLQLLSTVDETHSIVVSTVMEVCEVFRAGLMADGTVKDVLYGLPMAPNKIADLSALTDELSAVGASMRILLDHPDQVKGIEDWEATKTNHREWSVFIKVDSGNQYCAPDKSPSRRAGLKPGTPAFTTLLEAALASPSISVYGFYTHAGNSYASTSFEEATNYLLSEVTAVNTAAAVALKLIAAKPHLSQPREPYVLSVGATPTAHAATEELRAKLEATLNGVLELHAGNYPLNDLQQLNTGLISPRDIASRVLATVISYYPGRGEDGSDEAMCDAGAIAMSKDTGPRPGYGDIIGKPWRMGRCSQEHGILAQMPPEQFALGPIQGDGSLKLGDMVQIVGQHACLILAGYPWYYVVDSGVGDGNTVVDVWVPWKGW